MVHLRARHDDDIPQLCTILAEQQPTSGYPFRWPLPMPVERFIARANDVTAFVATTGTPGTLTIAPGGGIADVPPDTVITAGDGEGGRTTSRITPATIVGHVAVGRVIDDDFGSVFTAALGRPADAMLSVTALFTSLNARGHGVGNALLAEAEQFVLRQNRLPVLDVLPTHAPAVALYARRGWRVVDERRAPWLPDDMPPIQYMALLDT